MYEDRLVREQGRKQEVFSRDNINKIKINRKHNGDLCNIILSLDNPNKNIVLARFDDMEDLLKLIKEMVPDKVIFQEKYYKKYQESKLLAFAIIFLVPAIILSIIFSMGEKDIEIFMGVSFIFVGILFLIYKPGTRVGTTNKWVEVFLGLIALLLGFFILIDIF